MYAERHSITFTTHSSDGTAEVYSAVDVTGRILQVQYVKTDLDDGSTITITGNTSGIPIMAITGMNASATHLPRKAITSGAGAAVTYDSTQTVHEAVVLAQEKVKIAIASGGNSKTGVFYITVG